MGFADRVDVARRSAGLTIEELSDRSGISVNTLRRRLKGGERSFTVDELSAIADATGSPFEYILVGDAWTGRAVAS